MACALISLLAAAGQAQEIMVVGGSGLNVLISDGDTNPRSSIGTDFGRLDLSKSKDVTFRIRNVQSSDGFPFTGDLVIDSISVDSNQFSIVSGPLPPPFPGIGEASFADFVVRYDPNFVGTHNATVTIRNNDPDGGEDPYTFQIRGAGFGFPEIAVFGQPDAFGDGTAIRDGDTSPRTADGTDFGPVDALATDQRRTFRIRNSGSVTLQVSYSDDSDAFRASGLRTSIGAGSFDDFEIIFDPQQSGLHRATVTLTNNDSNEGSYTFRVQGTARAPEISVEGGSPRVTISNGDTTPRENDGTLFPLTLIDDSPVDRVFRIRNTQSSDGIPFTGDLIVDSVTSDSSQFSIAGATSFRIGEANFAEFTVRYHHTQLGTHDATITINHNDPDGDEDPYTFEVRGTTVGVPDISVFGLLPSGTPVEIADGDNSPRPEDRTDFGSVDALQADVRHPFRVRNTGTAPLEISLAESTQPVFRIEGMPASVPPGGSADFDIVFDPGDNGEHSAEIRIHNNDRNSGEDFYTFRVQGSAFAPELAVKGGSGLDVDIANGDRFPSAEEGTEFGSTLTRVPIRKTFRLVSAGPPGSNRFTRDMVITEISVSGSEFFRVLPPAVSEENPITLEPGGTRDFTIRFEPEDRGVFEAMVTVRSNDPNDDPFTFPLHGIGMLHPPLEEPIEPEFRFGIGRVLGVSFPTEDGRLYKITTSTDLRNFTDAPGLGEIVGNGDVITRSLFGFAPSAEDPRRYFRVETD